MCRRASVPSVDGMNTSSKLFRLSAAVLAAGGFCWVVKFVVIAASDGAVSGMPNTATAILYISAVTLMALGMAGLGVALLSGRHVALRALGAVGGLVAWWISYMVIEGIAKAIVGDTDPAWLGEEIGIVATGAVLMTVGLLLAPPNLHAVVRRGGPHGPGADSLTKMNTGLPWLRPRSTPWASAGWQLPRWHAVRRTRAPRHQQAPTANSQYVGCSTVSASRRERHYAHQAGHDQHAIANVSRRSSSSRPRPAHMSSADQEDHPACRCRSCPGRSSAAALFAEIRAIEDARDDRRPRTSAQQNRHVAQQREGADRHGAQVPSRQEPARDTDRQPRTRRMAALAIIAKLLSPSNVVHADHIVEQVHVDQQQAHDGAEHEGSTPGRGSGPQRSEL